MRMRHVLLVPNTMDSALPSPIFQGKGDNGRLDCQTTAPLPTRVQQQPHKKRVFACEIVLSGPSSSTFLLVAV
eukprot:m.50436 g.50436  ORF g.50436 m.50436 type:complete len:73 (-) comp48121_c0_seq1:102-320(-)